ncbi:MAG TPA: hypothetical protein VNX47_13915, partial [Nevskia sp.]|nr:hypothetical protein [Nevskia sp.]
GQRGLRRRDLCAARGRPADEVGEARHSRSRTSRSGSLPPLFFSIHLECAIFFDAGVIDLLRTGPHYPQRLSITFVQLLVTIAACPVVACFFPVVTIF